MRSLLEKDFRYYNAELSKRPGYLAERFKEIRAGLAEKQHKVESIFKVKNSK